MSHHDDGAPMKFQDWVYEISMEELNKLVGWGWIGLDEVREEIILNRDWLKRERAAAMDGRHP